MPTFYWLNPEWESQYEEKSGKDQPCCSHGKETEGEKEEAIEVSEMLNALSSLAVLCIYRAQATERAMKIGAADYFSIFKKVSWT